MGRMKPRAMFLAAPWAAESANGVIDHKTETLAGQP
jgi:hypothetical protein